MKKPKQIHTLGEGLTHLIINGDNVEYLDRKEAEAYLAYLENFTAKLRTELCNGSFGKYKW